MSDVVPVSDRRDQYNAAAGQTIFDISFPIADVGDVAVYINGDKTDDVTVNVKELTVTLDEGTALNDIITIDGLMPVGRKNDYQRRAELSSLLVNLDFNRIIRMVQELRRDINRGIILNRAELDDVSPQLPKKVLGRVFVWGQNGIENGPATTDLDVVAQHLDEIDAVAAIDDEVVAVAGIVPAVSGVAANEISINGVYNALGVIGTVYGALTSIGIVAAAIAAVQSAYDNLAAIIAAPAAASSAASSASLSQSWAVDNIGARPAGSAKYWAEQSALYGGSVKVTAVDTTPAVLNSKLTVGTGLTKATVNPGANEQLNIAVNFSQVATAAQGAKADIALTAPAMLGRVLYGCIMSNGTDTVNDINISAGSCISDDGTTVMTSVATTKQLDAAWVVGTGVGGRDTGSIADNTWHVWRIHRTDTGVTDTLFSLSATAPTMPANYNKKKRIGSIVRVSGGILQFVQTGNKFRFKGLINNVAAAAQNNAARDTRTLSVPTGIMVEAEVCLIWACPASSDYGVLVTDLVNDPDTAVTLTNASMNIGGNGGYNQGMTVMCSTNTSAQIGIRASTAGGTVNVSTRGWTDWGI